MGDGKLKDAIAGLISEEINPAGESYRCLRLSATRQLAREFSLPGKQVEIAALEEGIVPERYQRSLGTVGMNGQINLLRSKVGVLGAGGLGGFAFELLARMGVGHLIVVDGDSFSESNLNRQLVATEETLDEPKAKVAQKRIKQVNSAIDIEVFSCLGEKENLYQLFAGCDIVLDCLDNLPSRFVLEKVCTDLAVPMIHGAIAGFLGQLAVIRPGKPVLGKIYGNSNEETRHGVEAQLGNPAVTPAMLGSWQAGEAIKILAGLEGVLPEGSLLIIDMQNGESYQIELEV
ncbi:MAG: HesA/MoeB/ThiF family protein [Bacillota bacterium]